MGSGEVYSLWFKNQANLTPPSHCHSFYPFYRATFPFFLLPFSFTFTFPLLFPILFSFPFSFFIFRFFSFLFLFSFYFLFFYFFIFFPSFPLLFLVALLEGARKGIINTYHYSILIIIKIILLIFKNF